MTPLAGRTALVTGGGCGIGRGCALELARAGADIVLNDRPDSTELAQTADDIRALGRKCVPLEADVFHRDQCAKLVERALAEVEQIDALVSNPALSRRAPFLEYDADDFEQVVQATLTSGFHISQLVARHMVERGGGGKIVFITSVHAENPYAGSVAYNAAKAGLTHMAATIAVELAPHRINVNMIAPGWIDTPGERAAFGDEFIRENSAALPWGRLGTTEDIGRAAAFLVSDAADYITGTVLRVDGGFLTKDCR